MPGDSLESSFRDVDQGFNDDVNVDGSPADNKDCHHYKNHPRDSPQVPVLLFGAR